MRNFTIVECEQRTPEWFSARLGRLTGSVAKDMLAKGRGNEEAVGKRDLRFRLAVERLTGRRGDDENGYVNAWMQWGIEHEADAFGAYEAVTGNIAHRTGFLRHDELMAGCSLDGHVGNFDALVSIKCPKSTTHFSYLRAGVMPPAYVPQMLHELLISGAREYHFLSWDGRLPDDLQTFFLVVPRDEAAVEDYRTKALAFLKEVENELLAVQTIRNLRGQLAGSLA